MSKVDGVECTNYFRGIDGRGTCDTECQWYVGKDKCPCSKGTEAWDGKEHYTKMKEEK